MPHCWGEEGMAEMKGSRTLPIPQCREESYAPEPAAAVPGLVTADSGRTSPRRGNCCWYPWQRLSPAPQDGGAPRHDREKNSTHFT